jgi:hypothetical protein
VVRVALALVGFAVAPVFGFVVVTFGLLVVAGFGLVVCDHASPAHKKTAITSTNGSQRRVMESSRFTSRPPSVRSASRGWGRMKRLYYGSVVEKDNRFGGRFQLNSTGTRGFAMVLV